MYKKTVTFEDFEGNEVTQDFYFHVSESDVMNKEVGVAGGWSEFLANIVKEVDEKKLLEEFEWFIAYSYGVKSEDGMYFDKSPEQSERFKQHAAYGKIFMDVVTDTKSASDFINQVFSKDVQNRFAEIEKKAGKPMRELSTEDVQAIIDAESKDQDKPTGPPASQAN